MDLTHIRTRAGIWEGVLRPDGDGAPDIAVSFEDAPVEGVELSPTDGAQGDWTLRFPIPAEAMSDGVQTVLITDTASGQRLGSYTIVAGRALDDDFRAELDLLRAELDMLKRAFRRHCVETGTG